VKNFALKTFQLFNKMSIFIDSKYFMELNKYKLLRLNYEINRLWNSNFTIEQQKEITNNYYNMPSYDLNSYSIDMIQLHILKNIYLLLKSNNIKYKHLINVMILYSLAIIIPEIRSLYPDLILIFN
jgi:hypothetical protein